MKANTLLALFLSLAMFAVSCDLSNSYKITGNRVFVNNYTGTIVSDEGIEYKGITNRSAFPAIDSCRRSYVECNMQGTSKDGSSITLTDVRRAEIVYPDNLTSPDTIVYEPTKVDAIWFGGGYLNIIFRHFAPTEDNPMTLKLTEIDSLSKEGYHHFELRLVSKTPVERKYDPTLSVAVTTCATFPFYQKYLKDKSACSTTVSYKWFKSSTAGSTELLTDTLYGLWTAGGFIQPALK